MVRCRWCGVLQRVADALLGGLGSRRHYRCRYCGGGLTMAIRNWWIEVEIEGRKTKLTGGPRAKDGGFTLVVRQRDDGESIAFVRIDGIVLGGGGLELRIDPCVTMLRNADGSLSRTTKR